MWQTISCHKERHQWSGGGESWYFDVFVVHSLKLWEIWKLDSYVIPRFVIEAFPPCSTLETPGIN